MKPPTKTMQMVKERGHRRRIRMIRKILIEVPKNVLKLVKILKIDKVTKPRIKRYSLQERIDMRRKELGIIL